MRRVHRTTARSLVLSAVATLGCRGKPQGDVQASAPAATPDTDRSLDATAPPTPIASNSEPGSPSPPAMPPASVFTSAYAGTRVPCGPTACRSGREVCCGWEGCPSESTCRTIDWSHGPFPHWSCPAGEDEPACPSKTARSCKPGARCDVGEGAPLQRACTDSRDCAGDRICCEMAAGTQRWAACGLPSECGLDELCREDHCRTGATRCDHGVCGSTRARVPCGDKTCSGRDRFCLRDDSHRPHCIDAAESDRRGPRAQVVECVSARDCGEGERCWWGSFRSYCAFSTADADIPLPTCESNSDCPEPNVQCRPTEQGPYAVHLCLYR
jgi:hypothetical protein